MIVKQPCTSPPPFCTRRAAAAMVPPVKRVGEGGEGGEGGGVVNLRSSHRLPTHTQSRTRGQQVVKDDYAIAVLDGISL